MKEITINRDKILYTITEEENTTMIFVEEWVVISSDDYSKITI